MRGAMRVDAHCHVIPDAYVATIPIPLPQAAPLDALEAMMERYAIDRAVVSTGPPGVFFGDPGQTRDLTRMVNEEMAAVRARDPDRFATLGMLPLPDVDAATAEL